MKHLVLILSVCLLAAGCKRGDEVNKKDVALLLKVDYLTYQLEGGLEQNLTSALPGADTIPLSIDYKPPGDFGSIGLYYKGEQLLFKGTIIWNGKGEIVHPVNFRAAGYFPQDSTPLPYPGNEQFKPLNYSANGFSQIPYGEIWKAIAKLRIVDEYLKAGKKISLLRYTPSVGMGNPAEWDWIVVMAK